MDFSCYENEYCQKDEKHIKRGSNRTNALYAFMDEKNRMQFIRVNASCDAFIDHKIAAFNGTVEINVRKIWVYRKWIYLNGHLGLLIDWLQSDVLIDRYFVVSGYNFNTAFDMFFFRWTHAQFSILDFMIFTNLRVESHPVSLYSWIQKLEMCKVQTEQSFVHRSYQTHASTTNRLVEMFFDRTLFWFRYFCGKLTRNWNENSHNFCHTINKMQTQICKYRCTNPESGWNSSDFFSRKCHKNPTISQRVEKKYTFFVLAPFEDNLRRSASDGSVIFSTASK